MTPDPVLVDPCIELERLLDESRVEISCLRSQISDISAQIPVIDRESVYQMVREYSLSISHSFFEASLDSIVDRLMDTFVECEW